MLILLSELSGISATGYDGKFVVSEKVSSTKLNIQFKMLLQLHFQLQLDQLLHYHLIQ